jgi:hypothetical protein
MVRLHLEHSLTLFRFRFLRNPDNGHVDGSARDRDRHFAIFLHVSLSKSAQSPALRLPGDYLEPTIDRSSSTKAAVR